MTAGLILRTDNTTERLDETSLETLQKAVGGWVQALDFSSYTMWVNEEGKLIEGTQPNFTATAMFINEFQVQDSIMGDVVFTGGTDQNGETLPLDSEVLTLIEQLASKLAA
jgi:hypothetical protein